MEVFKVELGPKVFSVVGIANIAHGTVKFQALINDIPFAQNSDYQAIREVLLTAVELNRPEKQEGVQ